MAYEATFDDFADGTDFVVVPEGAVDSMGRQTQFIYWIGMVGPRHEEVGVRGQIHRCVVADAVRRLEAGALDGRPRKVRVVA